MLEIASPLTLEVLREGIGRLSVTRVRLAAISSWFLGLIGLPLLVKIARLDKGDRR